MGFSLVFIFLTVPTHFELLSNGPWIWMAVQFAFVSALNASEIPLNQARPPESPAA